MGERLTRAQAAEALGGVSRQRVHELIEAGSLVEDNGTLDADQVEAVRASFDVDKVQRAGAAKEMKGAASKAPDPVARTFNMARAQDQVLKAKQRKLEFEIAQGKWVDRELVIAQCAAAGKILAHRLEAACTALAPQLCAIKDQREAHALLVRTLIEGVLADFRGEISVEHDAQRADQEGAE